MQSALKTFGFDNPRSLLAAAVERYGSADQVKHEIALLNRRLRYAATTSALLIPTEPGLDAAAYVREFERLNSLKPLEKQS